MELKAGKVAVTYADEGSDIESMVATGGVTFISGEIWPKVSKLFTSPTAAPCRCAVMSS